MRIMIDTNVLVSVLVFKSSTLDGVIGTAVSFGNTLLIPTYVIDEAYRTINHKFPANVFDLDMFLQDARYELIATPNWVNASLSIRDPKDLPVLRSAIAGRADVLVTGDKDFADADTSGVLVLSPTEFRARFN